MLKPGLYRKSALNQAQLLLAFLFSGEPARTGANLWPPHRLMPTRQRKTRKPHRRARRGVATIAPSSIRTIHQAMRYARTTGFA